MPIVLAPERNGVGRGRPRAYGQPMPNDTATATATDTRTVVLRYIEALQRGDLATARDSFAPDATWWFPGELPISGTWTGPTRSSTTSCPGPRPAWTATASTSRSSTWSPRATQAVLEWVSRADTIDGERYENANSATFVVRDGRIQAVREYTDTQFSARVLFGRR